MKDYIRTLLKKGLGIKKGQTLFVCVPAECMYLNYEILEVADELGIKDIEIRQVEKIFENSDLSKAIEDGNHLLFLINNNKDKKYVEMLNYICSNDLGINYTIALAPRDIEAEKELLQLYCSLYETNGQRTWEEIEDELVKKVGRIKSLGLESIVVDSLLETEAKFGFDDEFSTATKFKRMQIFPKYSLELHPKKGTFNGFVSATANTYFDAEPVEELRLFIKDGMVDDFDASKGGEIAKKYLSKHCDTEVVSLGLIDSSAMTYDKFASFNNFVLDRERSPYILLRSYNDVSEEAKYIYVPLAAGSLKVYGINQKGKKLSLYEEEGFTKRIEPKRK